ncbi:MAG: S41 family peptidase [Bdellovibrio sp.]|jgi:carboxyl-terminal processing protease
MSLQKFLGKQRFIPSRTLRTVLLLCLEVVLVIPNCAVDKIDRGAKSADYYWQNAGLSSRELEIVLGPQSCLQDHKTFLGCVNAIGAMAERYNLALSQDGQLVPLTDEMIQKRLTEKRELQDWEHVFAAKELSPGFSFIDLWQQLDQKYVQAKERSAVVAAGLNGFLSVTKDPHTYLLPLALYEEVVARSDARPSHLGFVSKRVHGGAYVRKVFSGSPAALAGLRKGDRILEVNGISVMSLHPSLYNDLLRARNSDRLRLLIERSANQTRVRKYVEILKSDEAYPNVLSKWVDESKNVGLVTIHKFSRETCTQVRRQVVSLKEEGLAGLILDLRDNPGGQVDEAACVLNLFVEKNKDLFETRYLDQTRPTDRYRTERDSIYKGPLTVLINGGSASASEIVAGSLKDLNRATLVGERSFGKGTFQDGHLWGVNPRVAYFETEGFYYFPTGWTPQLVGLEPDLKVSSLEDETLREEDLYYSSIRPSDLWEGPQALSWMNEMGCIEPGTRQRQDDPQIEMAFSYLNCDTRNSNGDRNGTL